jgi:hypothetical protein
LSFTVEGIGTLSTDDAPGVWSGVDCAKWYGAEGGTLERAELIQLKYSAAAPTSAWTVGRITKNSAQKGDNSVLRKLAVSFRAATQKLGVASTAQISSLFISNQPIARALASALDAASKGIVTTSTEQLRVASGLRAGAFKAFASCLKLKGGEAARSDLRAEAIIKVGRLLDTASDATVDGLVMKLRERMLPHGDRVITRETVESWFGVGLSTALFPCEPLFETPRLRIERQCVADLAKTISTHRLTCLSGGAGHGKTTALLGVRDYLPAGSIVVAFDCYGAGGYSSSAKPRHGPLEAFTQLSNEIAKAARVPLLIPHRDNPNIQRSFDARVRLAAELARMNSDAALVVILIDAADNAVAASSRTNPQQDSFLSALLTMHDLPANVRVAISSRASRIESLRLPDTCKRIPCPPFVQEETSRLVRSRIPDAPDSFIEEFHTLTKGVPRLQTVALECGTSVGEVLAFLGQGKSLDDVYADLIRTALSKAGDPVTVTQLCAALSAAPLPAPCDFLSDVCGMSAAIFEEIVEDLSPNLRIDSGKVEFANEDFEDFCGRQGENELPKAVSSAASACLDRRDRVEYAALHLFDLMSRAGRGNELLSLLEEPAGTKAIADPVVRRRTDLSRIRAIVAFASQHNDELKAIKTIVIGAESVRSETKVRDLILENPDLSANFLPDTLRVELLSDPSKRSQQGRVLMHLASAQAIAGERLRSLQTYRNVSEWFRARESPGNKSDNWHFTDEDLGALAITVFVNHGWAKAEDFCSAWRPEELRLVLAIGLVKHIALARGPDEVRQLRELMSPDLRWIATLALTRAKQELSPEEYEQDCEALCKLRSKALPPLPINGLRESRSATILDALLSFLQCCSAARVFNSSVPTLLRRIVPRQLFRVDQISSHEFEHVDLCLRAALVEARHAGVEISLDSVFREPPNPTSPKGQRQRESRSAEWRERLPILRKFAEAYHELDRIAHSTANNDPSIGLQLADKAFSTVVGRLEGRWLWYRFRPTFAHRVVDLHGIKRMSPQQTLAALGKFTPLSGQTTVSSLPAITSLLYDHQAFDLVVGVLEACSHSAKTDAGRSTERADVLLNLSRALLSCNRNVAEIFYRQAIALVEEIDIELVDQAHCLTRMAGTVSSAHAVETAERLTKVIHKAGSLIGREDGFPDDLALETATRLSPTIGGVTASRWADEGFGAVHPHVSRFAKAAASAGMLPPSYLAALCPLIDGGSKALWTSIAERALREPSSMRRALAEELSAQRLLNLSPTDTDDSLDVVECLVSKDEANNHMTAAYFKATAFLREHIAATKKPDRPHSALQEQEEDNDDHLTDAENVDVGDADAIQAARERIRKSGRMNLAALYDALRARTSPSRRLEHLNALKSLGISQSYPDTEIEALISCLLEWKDPASQTWSNSHVPALAIELGPRILGYSWYHDGKLQGLLKSTNATDHVWAKSLISAVEKNASACGSQALLMYAATITEFVSDVTRKQAFDWYANRLEARMSANVQDDRFYDIDKSQLPTSDLELTAHLVYRFLGDIDCRVRWNAVHSARAFVRLNGTPAARALLACASNKGPSQYTFGTLPFYELTARVYLAIALARLAAETPDQLRGLQISMLHFAQARPNHLLVQHYIKRALVALRGDGADPTATYQLEVEALAVPSLPRATRPKQSGRGRMGYNKLSQPLRFHFDGMDVLPYWYSPLLNSFADVTEEEFLTAADSWIVDTLRTPPDVWQWDKEPRKTRIENRGGFVTSIRHGSYPTIERYSVYLQWHAMFVMAAELLKSRPLAEAVERDSDSFASWLEDWDTLYAPKLKADCRGPFPLDRKAWQMKAHRSDQRREMSANELQSELFTEIPQETVLTGERTLFDIVGGTARFQRTTAVQTALVDPRTADALSRMLREERELWKVRLAEGHQFEDQPLQRRTRFDLIPTSADDTAHRRSGFDQYDPNCFETRGIEASPSMAVRTALNLVGLDAADVWHSNKEQACHFRSWSNRENSAHRSDFDKEYGLFATGHRLTIRDNQLERLLERTDSWLIAVVSTNWRAEDGYRDDEKEEEREQFEVFLIKPDRQIWKGSVSVGTW